MIIGNTVGPLYRIFSLLKQNYCFILEESLTLCSRFASPNLTYSAHLCTLLIKRMHSHEFSA